MESFMKDMFEKIAEAAADLLQKNNTKTLGSSEIEAAVKLVIRNNELCKNALAEGTKAVNEYQESIAKVRSCHLFFIGTTSGYINTLIIGFIFFEFYFKYLIHFDSMVKFVKCAIASLCFVEKAIETW